jgi:hypothetical protein
MIPDFRAFSLVAALLATPAPAASLPDVPPDTAALEFHCFRAGARLDELDALVTRLDGRLHCDRARVDHRVTECRAALEHAELGGTAALWVSAIDSVAGVITVSGDVDADRLERWRRTLEQHYGHVDAQAQGTQWMMQWVRQGRMLRLTWRIERGRKMASVSLVDGRVLDAWGRARAHGAPEAVRGAGER